MRNWMFAMFAAFCAFIAGGRASAGTFNWTGAANDGNKWSSSGNWQEKAAPSAATDIAVFDIAADVTTDFNLSVSPVIEKRGAGKLTLYGGSSYNNAASTGSVFLYGGSLDLGGGTCKINQTSDGDAAIAAGTALYNATVAYSTAYNGGPCVGMKLPEGTVTLGSGVVWTAAQGFMLSYGTPSGAATDTRALVLDGATWNNPDGVYVCGANTSSSTVNDGTFMPTTLELKNGATLNLTAFNKTVRVGASFNGNHSPVNGAGILKVTDSTVVMNGGQMHINDVDSTKSGNQNCYGLIEFDNSTLTFNGVYNRPNLLTSNRDSNQAAHSYAEIVLKNTTATLWSINAMSLPYTGSTSLLPDGYTAILRLDGATLVPRGARSDFIYNSKQADRPAVKLENNASVIDTAYDVTVPAVAFGDGGWTKRGEGTLTLSGANTYTGATRVEAGTLNLTGSIAGGIEAVGGTFTTSAAGTYPSLLMDGGTAQFTGAEPCTFTTVEIGENGGTLALGVKGFAFNGVTGTANLSALTLSATPSGWGTGEVLMSDSPAFLAWAAEQLNGLLPAGFTASVSGTSVAIDAEVEIKTTTWTGSGADASWATDENWDAGAPGTADTVILDGNAKTATTLDANLAPASIAFAATAGAFTVSGGGSLAVSVGITNLSANAQTFNVPVTLSGATGIVHAEGDIAFASGLAAASVVKDGAGTMTLRQSYTGPLDIEEGGVALVQGESPVTLSETAGNVHVGGLLGLGGGSLALAQPDSDDFILRSGAILTNGTFSYSSSRQVYDGGNQVAGFMFSDGTVTIGEGATLSFADMIFPYGPSAPTATFGARRVFVDGGTLNLAYSGSQNVIGVNNDWGKSATLEVANGGTLTASAALVVGARNSGTGTSSKSKGVFIVRDGASATVAGKVTVVNSATGGESCGIVAVTNATVHINSYDGICLFGYPYAQTTSSSCDARFVMDGGTLETWHLVACAMAGTGKMAGQSTGTVHLGGGAVVRALGNDRGGQNNAFSRTEFIFNGASDATYPAVELLAGGVTIDSQNHSVTASAVMYGEGGLVKDGSGTLTISGANTYTGETVVSNGTLVVAAGGALAGPVRVKSGATLSVADSSTAFASFTLEKGGRIAIPEYDGDSVDLFTVTGEVELLDNQYAGGRCLSAKPLAGGGYVVRYGKSFGLQVIIR